MFAIQWALVVCNLISCVPTIPSLLFAVDSEKFVGFSNKFFDKLPSAQDLPLLRLMMKFQFLALFALYILGVLAGIFCATPVVGYMFAIGNFVRVAYFAATVFGNAQKFAYSGMSRKQVNIILIVQTVLGVVILAATYCSAQSAEYQTAMKTMADEAAGKWETQGFYIKFVLAMHGFFTFVQIPGVVAPNFAIKNYITVESKLPTEKGASAVLEFVMGFQQLAILMLQIMGGVMLWYSPVIDPIALFWMIFGGAYFTFYIFAYNIINAEAYGFDRVPMIVFLILNTWVAGASFQAYFA